jgi:CheY-like chemotaxis protein
LDRIFKNIIIILIEIGQHLFRGKFNMKTILIIDDEGSMRQLLKECLTKWGYHVQLAKDGWEGIRMINDECKYDAILTDIGMPDIDGKDVANHIKKSERPHTPIMAITGLNYKNGENLFNYILRKPFRLEQLKVALESLNR